jgi:hypothetical protein
MSAAGPKVFADREVVVQDASTGRSYTPRDYAKLFTDAKLPWAKDIADYNVGLRQIRRFLDSSTQFITVTVTSTRRTSPFPCPAEHHLALLRNMGHDQH